MQAQGETLLRELVDYEKTLANDVDKAKEKAASIINEAEDNARASLASARKDADQYAQTQLKKANTASQKAHDEVLEAAQNDVSALQESAKKHQAEAVSLIVERVLP